MGRAGLRVAEVKSLILDLLSLKYVLNSKLEMLRSGYMSIQFRGTVKTKELI